MIKMNIFHALLEEKIREFYEYIDIMESSIKVNEKKIKNEFEEQSKNLTDENADELLQHVFLDPIISYTETFPFILRKSLYLSLYSFVETELSSIAYRLEKKHPKEIKINDLKHKGIRLYIFYIENVQQIQLNLSSKQRENFIQYNTLRNYFAHNEGSKINPQRISQLEYYEFKKFFPDQEEIHVSGLKKEFNQEFLGDLQQLFKNIYNAIGEWEI
ncbi:hypothetical protein [Tenuibacillus multivorans]|uniref:RiboL-PSP-HEPN domain-containing protein n=1 Tax=Tenuibacillus multivorans TaxID=237069 RepID=A0A1H0CG24_9BACI|nr:hypothetical protein [Tenuibacillus multivorans]GEL76308.1 hypothetical protein TMU01_05430 [Tenuibacillus multivorans]SDN56848.1 hypothetical protein SAMN05216498_2526 [Tenuibacillus multivorans]